MGGFKPLVRLSAMNNGSAFKSAPLRFVLFLIFLASCLIPLATVLYSQSQTEFGMAGDLTVRGRGGTTPDPDVKIKGFTVFGSTQSNYTGIVPGDGNVVINGRLSVSSGAYIVGSSTFTGANKIFIGDGHPGEILMKSGQGSLDWTVFSGLGDNLGNHVATTTLNMNANSIVNAASGTFTSGITASSFTALDAGFKAARLRFSTGNVVISSSAGSQSGVNVSTNMFIVGIASATGYYGDGSVLSGILHSYRETRVLGGNGSTADIGNFLYAGGMHSLYVTVFISDQSSWAVSKQYAIPLSHDLTGSYWRDALPISNTGAAAGNDFVLEVNASLNQTSLRLRRSGGTTSVTAVISLEQLGPSQDVYTPSYGATSGATANGLLSVTPLTGVGGNVGIGLANPASKLQISSGTLKIDGDTANSIVVSGNVGIGTTAPAGKLQVTGNALVSSSMAVSGAELSGTTPVFQVAGGTMTVLADHNVGIGTDTPKGLLHVGAGITPGLMVATDGKVGIGTTSPGAALDVAGQVRITGGSPAEGKVLQSDDNGLGHWELSATDLSVGNSYGGGTIFWVDSLASQVLIAATADQSSGAPWSNNLNATGATLDGVYAGKANTVMISTMQERGDYAARICSDYSATVNNEYYDDWYLPSAYELGLLYAQKDVVGGFAGSQPYWSSDEDVTDPATASEMNFGSGSVSSVNKTLTNSYVRCIRAGPATAIGNLPTNFRTVTNGAYLSKTQTFTGSNTFKDITADPLTASSAAFTNTGDAGLAVNSDVYLAASGGRVGIGTTSPAYGLEVIKAAGAHLSTAAEAGAGFYLNSDGSTGLGTAASQAALDMVSTGTESTEFGQIWRSRTGVVVASMSATGMMQASKFIGYGGGSLTGVPGDNLGNHVATMTLTANYGITSSTAIKAGYFQIYGSTVLAAPGRIGNLSVGIGAGSGAAGSNNNTVVGSSAAYSNAAGSENSLVGARAGYYDQTGSANAIAGVDAGGFGSAGINSFSSSTILGAQAGYSLSNGSADNIFLGVQAGYNVTTGTGNIIIGDGQDTSAATASNELNLGGLLYGDLAAKTIGISTRSPQAALDIVSTGTDVNVFAQIWRDGSGVIVASMSSTGVLQANYFVGDGSGLFSPDNMGNHVATTTLNMSRFDLLNANYITASSAAFSGQLVVYGTATLRAVYASSVTLGDQLIVYGTSTLRYTTASIAALRGQLVAYGTATLGNVTASSLTLSDQLVVYGSATLGNVSASSAALSDQLVVYGTATLRYATASSVTLSDQLVVYGTSTLRYMTASSAALSDQLVVYGSATLGYVSASSVTLSDQFIPYGTGTLRYVSASSAPLSDQLIVYGTATFRNLTASVVALSGQLVAYGTTTLRNAAASSATLSDQLIVYGTTTLEYTGASSVTLRDQLITYGSGALRYVTASSMTLSDQLVVYGTTTLRYVTASSAALRDQLVVYGTSTLTAVAASSVTLSGPLTVYGAAVLDNFAASSATFSDQLTVYGTTTLRYVTLSSAALSDQLIVYGTSTFKNVTASSAALSDQLVVYGTVTLGAVAASSAVLSGQLSAYGQTALRAMAASSATLSDQLVVYGTTTLKYVTASSAALSDPLIVYGTTTLRYVTASSAALSDQLVVYGTATLGNMGASSAALSGQLSGYGTAALRTVAGSSMTLSDQLVAYGTATLRFVTASSVSL